MNCRLLYASLSPRVCSNSCPLSLCYHSTISISVSASSSCSQSFPVSDSFPMSWLFVSVAKVVVLHLCISLSNEYSGLISFRIDRFDLLAAQGTLKNSLQHHNLKASILWHSRFFMAQLSHPHMTTGKSIALTICTFVIKVVSLLFITLSKSFSSKE